MQGHCSLCLHWQADNYKGIASAMGILPKALLSELVDYAIIASGEREDPFGKTVFPHGPLNHEGIMYVMKVTPVIHYTMGGLSINTNAEVISTSGSPIPGLLAAGEVTGGYVLCL